jgi:hypothetical protein
LLARSPRGATEDVLVVGHGLSADMLAVLVLNRLAKVVTTTLRVEAGRSRLSVCISRMPVDGHLEVIERMVGVTLPGNPIS